MLIPYLGCEVIQTGVKFLYLVYLILVALTPEDNIIADEDVIQVQSLPSILMATFELCNHVSRSFYYLALTIPPLISGFQVYLWLCVYSLYQVYRFGKPEDLGTELEVQRGPPPPYSVRIDSIINVKL